MLQSERAGWFQMPHNVKSVLLPTYVNIQIPANLNVGLLQVPANLNVGLLQVPAYVKAGCFKFRRM